MRRYSRKGKILKQQRNLVMKQRYVTHVVHNEAKMEKPEILEEVKMRPELEQRLENNRLELKFIRKMRREKLLIISEIQSDPSWTKSMDDKPGDSPFEEIYHTFITTEEFMISQQECPDVEKSVNAYIRKQVQTRQKSGLPIDSDEITVEVMEMMNNVYKEYLAIHMRYLDDLVDRYTHKLEVKKLEKEFYSLAVNDRKKRLEMERKLREKKEEEERMKEEEEQKEKNDEEKKEDQKDEEVMEEQKEEEQLEDQKEEELKEEDVKEEMKEKEQLEDQKEEELKEELQKIEELKEEEVEENQVDEREKENSPIATK